VETITAKWPSYTFLQRLSISHIGYNVLVSCCDRDDRIWDITLAGLEDGKKRLSLLADLCV